MDGVMARWRRLGSTLQDNAQRIQELMAKLMQFEVRTPKDAARVIKEPDYICSTSPFRTDADCDKCDTRIGIVLIYPFTCCHFVHLFK